MDIPTLIAAGAVTFAAVILWMTLCNERAFIQQARMLLALRRLAEPRLDLLKELETVSLGDHAFRLFTFRDPMKLYSKDWRELMNEVQGH